MVKTLKYNRVYIKKNSKNVLHGRDKESNMIDVIWC